MKLLFVSLGCDKNLVDSEHAIALLSAAGFESVDDENEADVIVVNTCCFILDAKQESIDTVLEMARLKDNKLKALIVCGCLAQRYRDEINKEIPEVDAVIDPDSIEDIVKTVRDVLKINGNDVPASARKSHDRIITTPGHYEYLKIAEGCDKNCTYCIIPKIRGSYRSYPMEDLVEEAKELAIKGVKELILVAQETTLYGTDIYGRKCLHELISELATIEGIVWIRVLYCYPEEIYDELIECMKN